MFQAFSRLGFGAGARCPYFGKLCEKIYVYERLINFI